MSFINLPSVGFSIDELNPFIFQRLKKEVLEYKNQFENDGGLLAKDMLRAYHERTAGYTKNYTVSDDTTSLITKEVLKLIDQFEKQFKYADRMFNFTVNIENKKTKLVLERLWMNFQRAGEFLPLHNHSGLYSFVIWVHIPFAKTDEVVNEVNPDLIKNRTSNFEFVYTDALGKLSYHSLYVDKKWEGKIAIFPAELYHQVYPFYSVNDVRISVAGNIRLEVEQ
jgi:hypothetical protein